LLGFVDQDGQTLRTNPTFFPAEAEVEEGDLVLGTMAVEAGGRGGGHGRSHLNKKIGKDNFTLHFPNFFPYVTISPRVAKNSITPFKPLHRLRRFYFAILRNLK
jgi:hypothetical protein